ncbi:SusC/RagA family TonB-linked outer membrane protein [Ferruginibacter yonginensis]|uniref:SusC/RagA family TonB-linked outer membrane protein n=1 Tax=Ferruginibacter yonginensis TaxID=1310416 RepID=A0ABV8QR56_9BACT
MLLFCAVASMSLYAQSPISGVVTNAKDGTPIAGVTVNVKGTSTNVQSSADGAYTITAPSNGTLVFTSASFTRIELAIAGQKNVNVALTPNTANLDEVVVVGYGTQQRKYLTGSVSKVESKAFTSTPAPSFDAALQGRAPGLQVQQANGSLGGAVRIRVRGTSSISASGEPLYVIDGVPFANGDNQAGFGSGFDATKANNTNPLATINQNDIESIEVLKDAASASIYGARAANGVILITTKKGKTGKTQISLDAVSGVSKITRKLPLLNGAEWFQLYNEARVNDGQLPLGPNQAIPGQALSYVYNPNVNTDWIDQTTQNGTLYEANLSARGGNDKTRFYLSGVYRDEKGVLVGNNFRRIGARVNIDNKASDRLDLGVQFGMYSTKTNEVPTSFNGGIGWAQSQSLPIYPVFNPDGSYFGTQTKNNIFINPVAQLQNTFINQTLRTFANVYAALKITKTLSFRSEFGLDMSKQQENYYQQNFNRWYQNTMLAAASERNLDLTNINTNNYFTFNKQINADNKIDATAGFAVNALRYHEISYTPRDAGVGFVNNFYTEGTAGLSWSPLAPTTISNGSPVNAYRNRNESGFLSYFARANYRFKDRYLFGASFRADASPRFGANNRYGYFPSVSAGWIASDESFLKDSKVINYLKLRTSYGLTGNAEIGDFRYIELYNPTGGYAGINGQVQSQLANPDLSWEKGQQFDFGVDYAVLKNRISGSLSFYTKKSKDLLLNTPVQRSTGFSNIASNVDVQVRNMGVELVINSTNFETKSFKWTSSLNISHNANKVLTVAGFTDPDFLDLSEGDTRVIAGYPLGINYLPIFAGVDPQTGDQLIFEKGTGKKIKLTPASQNANRVPVGTPNPDFYGGFENNFTYKGFDLGILLTFQYGNTIYDDGGKYQMGGRLGSWNQRRELLSRWQKPGDITDVPKVSLIEGGNADNSNSSRYLYDVSFLRVRSISLGYNLPKSILNKAKLTSARIYVSGQNLFTFTKYAGWDPEVVRYRFNNGASNGAFNAPYLPTPQSKSINFGLNIGL